MSWRDTSLENVDLVVCLTDVCTPGLGKEGWEG